MLRQVLLSCLLVLLLPVTSAVAQTGEISGRVIDSQTEEPLPGANVVVTELQRGAATSVDGEYEITGIEAGTYTLQASFVGYIQTESEVTLSSGEEMTVNFELRPDVSGLEEIVVTGIASERSRATSEVAVSRIDAEELTEKTSFSNISDLLNGKAAGVRVQQASGSIGSGVRFKMRAGGGLKGTGQPVVYVDGTRVDNSEVEGLGAGGQGFGGLADLNPEDIAEIDILKGPAAAALYGTSGSNGVVLITTKSGTGVSGRAVSVDYSSVVGYNEQAQPYTAQEFLTYEGANNEFRRGGIMQHDLSLSGGVEGVQYFASVTNRNEEGILRNNNMDRTSLRANFEAVPAENLTVRVQSNYVLTENERTPLDNAFGPLNNTIFITDQQLWSKTGSKEAVYAYKDVMESNRFIGSVNLTYEPIDNLQFQATVGYDGRDMREDQTEPVGYSYGGDDDGQRELFQRQNEQQNFDFNARYSYDILSNLSATSIVGTQVFNRLETTFLLEKDVFPAETIMNIGAGEEFISADETAFHTRSAGIFTQHEFNYNDTYFFTLGGRQDYASSVGVDAPSIFYPKVSGAIRLDRFDFLPSALSFLKLRGAYGESGQLPQPLDGAGRLWAASNFAYGAGAIIDVIGNPEVKPERVKEVEVGLETGFFQDYSLDLTYYRQNAQESIIEFQQSPSTGLTADDIPFNVGRVSGQGIEASLSATPVRTSQTRLAATLNWSYSKNEVKDLGGAQPIIEGDNVIREGLPRSAFYPYQNNGALFNEDGTYAGADISFDERVFVGTPYPKHEGSFSLDFQFFENFNFYAMADWAIDQYVINSTGLIAERYGNYAKRLRLAARLGEDRFREEWEEFFPDIQQLEPGTPEYREVAHEYALLDADSGFGYVQRADFFKIRELSLSYNFTDLINSFGGGEYVRNMRVTFSSRNTYTSTLYEGPDPEVHWQGARTISQGEDFTSLQHPRVWTVSLSMGI